MIESLIMRAVNLISLLAVFIALISAKSVHESRIINGHDAIDGQFKYQASLRSKLTDQHNCGASILNNRFLLTAAHCCQSDHGDPAFVYAVVGALRQFSGGIAMDVNKIITHDAFRYDTAENDIALIRTVKDIIFNYKIQPIALPKGEVAYGQPVVVSGWGVNEVIRIQLYCQKNS